MTAIHLIDAVTQALAFSLNENPQVVVFGEDVGKNGGVFRATIGLQARFGSSRVFDTPLAENMIAGIAIGMAMHGLIPIAEFQFMGFIYPAFDQIISHAARMRNRTRGRHHCPLVFRAPYGGGIHAPEHHSESTEALFAHISGIRVVIPSTPARAYGLLRAAILDPDPVIFLEPKRIYRWAKQYVPDTGTPLPLDRCFIETEGHDLTLVSWGACMKECHEAVEQLAEQGISIELIDVATIKPLDINTILDSVEKTRRIVIVHEAARSCGVGAEIAAQISEYTHNELLAPVHRVTGYDTIMPYAQLEHHYLPSTQRIIHAIKTTLEWT